MSEDGRRYSDAEVEAILALAARHESTSVAPARSGTEVGLTREDLHEIAEEVGMSREAIDLAAARLDGIIAGADTESLRALLVARTEGELDEEAVEDLADYLRRLLGRGGTRQESSRGFTMTFQGLAGPRYVTVRNRRGGVELEVEQNLRPGGLFHGSIVGFLIGMVTIGVLEGLGLPEAVTLLGIPAGIGGGWLSHRTWWRAIARRKRKELAALLRRIEREVGSLVGSTKDPDAGAAALEAGTGDPATRP